MERLEIESAEFSLLEEQRESQNQWYSLLKTNRKLMWILVHVLLILDVFFVLYYLLLCAQKASIGKAGLALFSLLGGLVLAYGLYGQKYRGHCLSFYAAIFHVFPALGFLLSLVIFLLYRQEAVAQYLQQFPHTNPITFTILLLLEDFLTISYHSAAASIILKCKKNREAAG